MERRVVSLLVVVSLVLAACGGEAEKADTASGEVTAPVEVTVDTSDVGGSTGGDGSAPARGEGADIEPRPSAGCGASAAAITLERHEVGERWYLLTGPEHDDPLPLVVDLHGLMEGAEVHAAQSDLGAFGQESGFVTVFPHGRGNPVMWEPNSVESGDIDFIDGVVEEVEAARCIDTARIYVTGLSMGAMMTSLLACTRADRYAAFAPVNGVQMPEDCDPARPVPMLAFHGTADPILLFNGGVDTSSFTGGQPGPGASIPETDIDGEGYPATLEEWAEVIGCDDPGDVTSGAVVERTWACPTGAALEFVIIEGQGHGWPGSELAEQIAILGPQVDGVDANEMMWEFFQRFALPG